MPIQKGSASFSRFRVEAQKGHPKDLAKALRVKAFQPLEPAAQEERAQGFVELGNKNLVEFAPGDLYQGPFAIFAYRVDEVKIPSAAIKAELEQWEQKFEAEHERKPGKKEKNDAKAELRHTLKSRYPLSSKSFEVSWHVEAGSVQLWAGSRKAVDEVQVALEQAFAVKLIPVAPVTVAAELGISEKSLSPTPQLSMPEEA